MSQFLRVIPNDLYNRLLDKGLLENGYPLEAPKTPLSSILSFIPDSIHEEAKQILSNANLSLIGNKLKVNNESCDVKELAYVITEYILKNPQVKKLPCWKVLSSLILHSNKASDQTSWVSFESVFKI